MDASELNVYNQMVESNTDNAKVAVEWLMARREASGGVEPNLLSGKTTGSPREEFRSCRSCICNERPAINLTLHSAGRREKLARSSVFKEIIMPKGKGTYGSKKGRPPKKKRYKSWQKRTL